MSGVEIQPESFAADYTGQPGERTFFIQARGDTGTYTYLVEKQQVAILAEKLREVLVLLDQTDTIVSATPARNPVLRLEAPIEPEWRVGTIGLAYEEDVDLVAVSLRPVQEGEDSAAEAAEEEEEEFPVRYLLRREQVRDFVLHSMAVIGEGRPLCQLCGLPMDPDGHNCPASNGHRAGVP
jgi:uncharacterized repeat protein (TIGR03847 family)